MLIILGHFSFWGSRNEVRSQVKEMCVQLMNWSGTIIIHLLLLATPGQHLPKHEVVHVFICPVAQVTCNAR